MKATAFGLIGGTVFALAFWSVVGRGQPAAAEHSVYQPSGDLIALSTMIEVDRQAVQQIAVVDPRTRTMSVYHIEPKSSAIKLKSVRNIEADLQMPEYNAVEPLPKEIRAMLERR
ncbi:MAG: hypothetical protein IT427_15440 [Pirellulales bacterium]|nr:hypothetical protein [Pirellulales bacterium]